VKILTLVARILVGLIFVVFGLNGFLNFLLRCFSDSRLLALI
jgi:uncharacterized membrane protein YphA (DoxX/SURF4 family)